MNVDMESGLDSQKVYQRIRLGVFAKFFLLTALELPTSASVSVDMARAACTASNMPRYFSTKKSYHDPEPELPAREEK